MSAEKYYNLREAADLLGIKLRTAREWARKGRLNATKYSGSNRIYIPESEIIRIQSEGRYDNNN